MIVTIGFEQTLFAVPESAGEVRIDIFAFGVFEGHINLTIINRQFTATGDVHEMYIHTDIMYCSDQLLWLLLCLFIVK